MRGVLVLCSLLVVANVARAQRCDDDLETCARQAYEDRDYALALARFRAMLAEGPTDALRLAVAQSLYQLGRFEHALEELDRIDLDADVRPQAEALRELAVAGLGEGQEPRDDPPREGAFLEAPTDARPADDPTTARARPAAPTDEPEPTTPGYSPSWLLWTGLGVTVVGALAATIAGIAVLDAQADWDGQRCSAGRAVCDEVRGRFDVAAPISTTGFIVSGVGIGLLVLELAFGAAGVTP